MILVVAQRWGRGTPDVAILAILSPPGFVRLHRGTGANLGFDLLKNWLGLGDHPVQQFDDFPNADLTAVEQEQQAADLSHGQACDGAQQGDQAGQTNPDAPLPQYLFVQINRSLVPALTLRTAAFEDAMMDHLHWLGLSKLDHFSHPCQADASQSQMALGTGEQAMFHDLGWHAASPSPIVLCLSFLSRLFLFCRAFLHILFDEFRRFALLFQFLNASQRLAQGFLHLAEFFSQLLIFRPEAIHFFLLLHAFQFIKGVKSEHLPFLSLLDSFFIARYTLLTEE